MLCVPNTAVLTTVTLSMLGSHDPQQNHLLAALSPAERERIYAHLRLVEMSLGKILYESGDVLRHVYFPPDSIVSLLLFLADGASAEISVVGNEGLIGIALKRFKSPQTILAASILSSTLFFLITNYAVWQWGTMYSHNWHGLAQCFTLALPFFRNTLVGDIGYTAMLFGAYEFALALMPLRGTKQSLLLYF